MLPCKKILVATDFSACADTALAAAVELAHTFDAELVLVHVVPDVARYLVLPDGMQVAPDVRLSALRQAGQELTRTASRLDGLPVRTDLREGSIAEAILNAARASEADLVVLGTQGRTGLRHLLLGSVAEAVVRRAPVPVLTVRTPS